MPATTVLDILSEVASADVRVTVLPSSDSVPFAKIWSDASRAAPSMFAHGAAVGMQLEASIPCLTALIAAWLAGSTVVSLPAPARRADSVYWAGLERMALQAGCGAVLAAEEIEKAAPPLNGIGTLQTFGAALAGKLSLSSSSVELPMRGAFVQFTSGSTGDPVGIVLSQEAMAANLVGALEVMEPAPGDGVCSWLPLSHDMGLFGFCLGALAGLGPLGAQGGDLVLVPMSLFRVSPMRWLTTCSSMRATVTAAPSSVLAMFSRLASRARGIDLRSLRSLVVGGESIDPAALEAFEAAYEEPIGLGRNVLSPAYGLAEMTVAVSMTSPRERWRVAEVSATDGGSPRRLVSCGPPLPGFSVSSRADGALVIDGPSVMSGRITPDGFVGHTGSLLTSDVGVVVDGRVFVIGRSDDVVLKGGRKIYATDVEQCVDLAVHDLVSAVALRAADGELVLVCEARRRASTSDDSLRQGIERAVVARLGVTPDRTLVVPNGSIPRTPTGKPRRSALAARLEHGPALELRPIVDESEDDGVREV